MSDHEHFRRECKHGKVWSQCRCIGPKTVTIVPCSDVACPGDEPRKEPAMATSDGVPLLPLPGPLADLATVRLIHACRALVGYYENRDRDELARPIVAVLDATDALLAAMREEGWQG